MLGTVGLDKTRFIVRLNDVNSKTLHAANTRDAQTYLAVREYIKDCNQSFVPGAKHWEPKKGSVTCSSTPLAGDSQLYLALGWCAPAARHYVTIEFNSAKLTPLGSTELMAYVQCMFDAGYAGFHARAECNYVEIPLDVVGVQMDDYLFFDTRLQSYDDAYEPKGTLYLGSKTSNRYWAIYDKAKQLADTKAGGSSAPWLRIEARLKAATPAPALHGLVCPFHTLRVVDKQKLSAIKHNIPVSVFRNLVLAEGMQPQTAFRMASFKQGLLAGLEPARPEWFDPATFWKTFPTATQRITPAGMNDLAQSGGYQPFYALAKQAA